MRQNHRILYTSSPQPFWHQGPVSRKTIFPQTGPGVGAGSGGNGSDGEWWGTADGALLTCPPLTSCCAAPFLTGRGPVSVCGRGFWTPALRHRSNATPRYAPKTQENMSTHKRVHSCSGWPQSGDNPNANPSADEWINKLWSGDTMEYYLAIKRNEGLLHAKTWKSRLVVSGF